MKILPINPLPPIKIVGFPPIKPLPSIKDCFNKNKNQKIMEKERKITAPYGCEIEKVELIDGVAVVTFREKERMLPKSCSAHTETKARKITARFLFFVGLKTASILCPFSSGTANIAIKIGQKGE